MAIIHSYFDMIIAEKITHLSYYMKGNMTGTHHRIFFCEVKISKRTTEIENQHAFTLCCLKNYHVQMKQKCRDEPLSYSFKK